MRVPITPSQTVGPYLAIGLPGRTGRSSCPRGLRARSRSAAWWWTGRRARARCADRDLAGRPASRFDHPDDPRGASRPATPGFRGFGPVPDRARRPVRDRHGQAGAAAMSVRRHRGAAPGRVGVRQGTARPRGDQDLLPRRDRGQGRRPGAVGDRRAATAADARRQRGSRQSATVSTSGCGASARPSSSMSSRIRAPAADRVADRADMHPCWCSAIRWAPPVRSGTARPARSRRATGCCGSSCQGTGRAFAARSLYGRAARPKHARAARLARHRARSHAGISLGGMIGMWAAAHAPSRVSALAVVCTSAYLPPPDGWFDRAAQVRTHGWPRSASRRGPVVHARVHRA